MKTAREIIAGAVATSIQSGPGLTAGEVLSALAAAGHQIVPPGGIHEPTREAAAKAVTQMGRCYDGLEPWTKPINADKAAAAIRALGATHG